MHDLAKDKNQISAKSSNQLEENKTPPLFGSALSQGIIKFEDQKKEPEVATLHKREVSLEKSKPKVQKEVVVVKLKPEQREEIKILKPFKINSCLIEKIEEALKWQFWHWVIDLEQNLMCSQWSITWCKKCINMSIKINNKWPNWRTKLIEYEMNENCLLNKFVKSINQMKENKSEFQCMIHLLRIKYFCTDWDSYLWSKCILSDAHEAHNLTPISKMYEDKVKQSSQISVQIDEWVNKLQESVSFIDNTKKLTLSKVQSKFDNFLNIVFEQRDILKNKVSLFADEQIAVNSQLIENGNSVLKELSRLIEPEARYNLRGISDAVRAAKFHIEQIKSLRSKLEADTFKEKLSLIMEPEEFEFSRSFYGIWRENPTVMMNTLSCNAFWSLYIIPRNSIFNLNRLHFSVWDPYNPERDFIWKIRITSITNSSKLNQSEETLKIIASSKEQIINLKDNLGFDNDCKISFRLSIQRIDPTFYTWARDIKNNIKSKLSN